MFLANKEKKGQREKPNMPYTGEKASRRGKVWGGGIRKAGLAVGEKRIVASRTPQLAEWPIDNARTK